MSGEPKTLTLTLEEALRELGYKHMSIQRYAWDLGEPGDPYVVYGPAPRHGEPGFDPDVQLVEVARSEAWSEAVSIALGVPVVARDETAELREENKRLSASVDDLLLAPNPLDDENMRLRAEAAELRAALDVARDAMVSALVYHHHSLGNPVKEELNAAVNRAGRALAGGESER